MAQLPSLVVVSAPSGTGKTTLNRRLVAAHPEVEKTVSLTTRPQRKGERDGYDYHFVKKEEFLERLANGEMLEHAEVFGFYYGSSLREIDAIRKRGHMPLLEIDVQGWQQAHRLLPEAKSVFILPPNLESLWQRLEKRGTDTHAVRWRRLTTADQELGMGPTYDYFIVNDELDRAYAELEGIVIHGKAPSLTKRDGIALCERLRAEFKEAGWLEELRAKAASGTPSKTS